MDPILAGLQQESPIPCQITTGVGWDTTSSRVEPTRRRPNTIIMFSQLNLYSNY